MYTIGTKLTRKSDESHIVWEITKIGICNGETIYRFDNERSFSTEKELDEKFDIVEWQEQESSGQTIVEFMRGNAYAELFLSRNDFDRRMLINEKGNFVVLTEIPNDIALEVLIETPDEAEAVKTLVGE